MANTAEESVSAQASGMTILAEPGPHEVSVATGSWRTRKYASAIWAATCSWRGEMSLMRSRAS
jgi:hypothetical protein